MKTLVVGPIETNCYLVCDQGEVLVIDPGFEAERLENEIEKMDSRWRGNDTKQVKVVGIVNTHGHFDHTGANQKLSEKYRAPVMIHPDDAVFLEQTMSVVHRWLPMIRTGEYQPGQPWVFLKDGAEIKVGEITFQVIHTPGHSPGSLCLYNKEKEILFSGDTLFAEGIGRTDLPGGKNKAIRQSIFNKLFVLPVATKVYPGHGPATTIGQEKGTNPDLYE